MIVELTEETPGADDYLRLRAAGGLSPFARNAAMVALPNSWHAVCLKDGERAIGMGRIVGDGGCFFQIVDIVVDPAYQGQGLGKRIMQALVNRLKIHAPKSAYVSLLADPPADRLYEQFGFTRTAPGSIGMAMRIE